MNFYFKCFVLDATCWLGIFWANQCLHLQSGWNQTHSPAPNITDGLLVFVQLVMAAITTEP